jgi:PhoPQ-activated pathogenicity-related protein
MATHVLQLLKMVQLEYGVTMICRFFFWSFHMIYIVYLLSVIWTFFLWSEGVILLISTNCHFNCKCANCAWLSQSLHYCLNFPFIIATKEMHKLVRCNWHLTELYLDKKWFHNVLDATLTDNFQYQNQLVDINNRAHCFLIASLSLTPTDVFSNHGAPPKVFHSEIFH